MIIAAEAEFGEEIALSLNPEPPLGLAADDPSSGTAAATEDWAMSQAGLDALPDYPPSSTGAGPRVDVSGSGRITCPEAAAAQAGTAASIGIGGAAGELDIEELAQAVYQHVGEGDIPGRPSFEEILEALQSSVGERIPGQEAVQFDYKGVRVIINEKLPFRSTAVYPNK